MNYICKFTWALGLAFPGMFGHDFLIYEKEVPDWPQNNPGMEKRVK